MHEWTDNTPHTHAEALPIAWRKVEGARVIHVEGATYRKSMPMNATFQLADGEEEVTLLKSGLHRIEVLCHWFDVKPPTVYPQITLDPGNYNIVENYTGFVVENIAAP